MMEESAVGDFANRLKYEFEDRDSDASDGDECQDWFVNDSRKEEPVAPVDGNSSPKRDGTRGPTNPPAAGTRPGRSVSSPATPAVKPKASDTKAEEERDDCDNVSGPMAFLHHTPPTFSILVMELATGVEVPRYGSKFFRIYIPQVHDSQTDFCLFARKRLNKNKFRFRLLATKAVGRVHFDIKQEARKQELSVRLHSQTNRFPFFRARSTSVDNSDVYRSNIQKFINPMADVRCSKTNYTLFKIEKEGETGMQKYVISYMRPFSLFLSCCIGVGVEAHLLE
uniref:Tubby C-terminal domain-containing protein n=1 Tax=Phytophthora ramorum TaxID=164328 RepID=H3GPD1_PHYRM